MKRGLIALVVVIIVIGVIISSYFFMAPLIKNVNENFSKDNSRLADNEVVQVLTNETLKVLTNENNSENNRNTSNKEATETLADFCENSCRDLCLNLGESYNGLSNVHINKSDVCTCGCGGLGEVDFNLTTRKRIIYAVTDCGAIPNSYAQDMGDDATTYFSTHQQVKSAIDCINNAILNCINSKLVYTQDEAHGGNMILSTKPSSQDLCLITLATSKNVISCYFPKSVLQSLNEKSKEKNVEWALEFEIGFMMGFAPLEHNVGETFSLFQYNEVSCTLR